MLKILFENRPIMKFSRTTLFLLIYALPFILDCQEINYSPKEYVDPDGKIYWNLDLPLYFRVSPYPEGQGIQLKSQNPSYSNPMYLDTEGTNYIRTRYAVDKESGKTVAPLREVLMPIIADGSGPVSSITFNEAQRSRSSGVTYYGPNLNVEITTSDELSGVEMLKYDLNGSGYQDVIGSISIGGEGEYTISYYGVDRVGNKEVTQSRTFTVDLTAPQITHNINGMTDGVIASTSKIYFTATDGLSGVEEVMYRFDDNDFRKYNGSSVSFSRLEDGDHSLEYYAIDEVGNQTATQSVSFYYDKTAPLTASDILGDRFIVGDRIYFSGRTKMKLTSVDNKIGVKDIQYSIDGGDFQVYDQPFYLPSIPGEHRIRYYSTDRLSNRPSGSETYKHNTSLVYVDLTGPDVRHRINGPTFRAAGVQYISPETKIQLVGNDKESGLQYLTYSIDGDAAEQRYTEPFSISTSGKHDIELFAYDNVNNRNLGSTEVYVDAGPPVIIENYSARIVGSQDGFMVYPEYVTIFLAATDDIVGNDKIYYRINGGSERLYTKPISQLRKDREYVIDIRAVDMVGNESTKQISFKTASE